MASILAQNVPTARMISPKFWATHEASLRDAILGQNSFLFSIIAERVLAPLREERGWGEATSENEAFNLFSRTVMIFNS